MNGLFHLLVQDVWHPVAETVAPYIVPSKGIGRVKSKGLVVVYAYR